MFKLFEMQLLSFPLNNGTVGASLPYIAITGKIVVRKNVWMEIFRLFVDMNYNFFPVIFGESLPRHLILLQELIYV